MSSVAFLPAQTLDCTGLACPMPILKTKKALDGLQMGQILKMIATDPGSVAATWRHLPGRRATGSSIQSRSDGSYVFYIQKNK